MLGGLVLGVATPQRDAISTLTMLEVNQIGTVINDPDAYVEEYVAAMEAFDAERMWATYNDDVRRELSSRGRSAAELQRGIESARAAGAKIDAAIRIGNYPLRDGRRYVFYIIRRSGFPPDGGPEEVYFIFTVDPNGKLLSVT